MAQRLECSLSLNTCHTQGNCQQLLPANNAASCGVHAWVLLATSLVGLFAQNIKDVTRGTSTTML